MATFYIQLQDKLLQISGELTAENISKALGYVPVSPNVTNELSQRVDNITFDSLKDNPFLQDGSGELNIVDEAGNIIAKIDAEGIHSVDFIAGNHKLTDKIDSSALNGYAKESWVTAEITKAATEGKVDLTGYATEEYVNNIDFYNINNNPIVNNGDGKLLFVDENGYIGLQLEEDGLYVKDVIADGHTLSQKADKSDIPSLDGYATESYVNTNLQNYATKDEVSDLVDMSVVTELQGKVNTLIDTDADKSVRDIAVDVLTETLVSETATEAYDTLAEMSAWIKSHPEDASAMNTAIQKNATDIQSNATAISNLDAAYKAADTKVLTDANEYTNNINFYTIKDNPIVNDGDGKLIFADENGNIGLQLEADNTLYVKDVIAGDNILSNKADKSELEGLATESYVITKVAEAKLEGSDIVIPVQDVKVNGQTVIKDMIADIDLTPYAKSEDVPSIEGLATEEWVTNKNYLTQHQDISHLASTEYVDEQIANVDVTEQLKDYALKSELPVNVSELNNDKGYLTQHQDISHLATKDELDNKDFYDIHNNPIVNDGDGKLLFVDESGNIGLQLEADNTLYVKDVIAGDHALTNKMDIVDNLVRVEDTDGEIDDVPEDVCVKYVTQSLTEEQKNQVRENLGIPSTDYIISLFEQLKQMIENNNASDAVAVLDKAILDMHKLQ